MNEGKQRITILSRKDLEFSYYCGPGHGGQAKNKVASGVMIRHLESGASGRAHDSRSQGQNKHAAFKRLCATPQIKFWIARKLHEIHNSETMEETIEKECHPKNLKLEIKDEHGRWKVVTPEYFETELAKSEHERRNTTTSTETQGQATEDKANDTES